MSVDSLRQLAQVCRAGDRAWGGESRAHRHQSNAPRASACGHRRGLVTRRHRGCPARPFTGRRDPHRSACDQRGDPTCCRNTHLIRCLARPLDSTTRERSAADITGGRDKRQRVARGNQHGLRRDDHGRNLLGRRRQFGTCSGIDITTTSAEQKQGGRAEKTLGHRTRKKETAKPRSTPMNASPRPMVPERSSSRQRSRCCVIGPPKRSEFRHGRRSRVALQTPAE